MNPSQLELQTLLFAWYDAHKHADSNTSILMLKSFDPSLITELCAAKMSAVGIVDSLLYSLEPSDNLPEPLNCLLLANKNPGCPLCLTSSKAVLDPHPDGSLSCVTKIHAYFFAKEKLMKYVSELYAAKPPVRASAPVQPL